MDIRKSFYFFYRFSHGVFSWFFSLPVKNGGLALVLVFCAVTISGMEAVYIQAATTSRQISFELFGSASFLFLLCLDFLVPLTLAFLSRRTLFPYFACQSFLSAILLHYAIFFYNPLTLSTIYHSIHGAASLGMDIFVFARWDVVLAAGAIWALKTLLLQLGRAPDWGMPKFWKMRGILAVSCMAIIWVVSNTIYGRTGLSLLWVDSRGHRTATERRLESGTREAVRSIGYVATWIGEWLSGTYRDTELIYAEMRCVDPDVAYCGRLDRDNRFLTRSWNGLPVADPGDAVVFMQVESLDFAAVSMRVNGVPVMPFLASLAKDSLVLRVFAPHKVGSSNADYEILNGRVADQNVIYYSYITEYPDSVARKLSDAGYTTSVFHGLEGRLFNLREAYAAQGFSHLFFKEEMREAGYEPSSYIMDHIRDEDVLEMAVKKLANGGRQAQFIVTMTTHMPFIPPAPKFENVGGVFAKYVSSLNYFDDCLANFYKKMPDGALFVLWGDHGSDVDYPKSYPRNDRQVPFVVHIKGQKRWLKSFPGTGGIPADERIYSLCELAHYLRRIVN